MLLRIIKLILLISFALSYKCFSDTLDNQINSVVKIEVEKPSGKSIATGFFSNKFGQILTNYHVVKDMTSISRIKHYEKEAEYGGRDVVVNCVDKLHDIAVLSIKNNVLKKDYSFIEVNRDNIDKVLNNPKDTNINKECSNISRKNAGAINNEKKDAVIILNSIGLKQHPKHSTINDFGAISEVFDIDSEAFDIDCKDVATKQNYNLLMMEHNVNPGSSGSPVILPSGELIGMIAGGIDTTAVFAIPVDKLQDRLSTCQITNRHADTSKAFESPLYTGLINKYSARLKTLSENITLNGFLISDKRGVEEGVIVDLYKRNKSGKQRTASSVTEEDGYFEFNTESLISDTWSIEVRSDKYNIINYKDSFLDPSDKAAEIKVINTHRTLSVKPEHLEPPSHAIENSVATVNFKVFITGLVAGEEENHELDYKWSMCDSKNRNDCAPISIPPWLKKIPDEGFTDQNNLEAEIEVMPVNKKDRRRYLVKVSENKNLINSKKEILISNYNNPDTKQLKTSIQLDQFPYTGLINIYVHVYKGADIVGNGSSIKSVNGISSIKLSLDDDEVNYETEKQRLDVTYFIISDKFSIKDNGESDKDKRVVSENGKSITLGLNNKQILNLIKKDHKQ